MMASTKSLLLFLLFALLAVTTQALPSAKLRSHPVSATKGQIQSAIAHARAHFGATHYHAKLMAFCSAHSHSHPPSQRHKRDPVGPALDERASGLHPYHHKAAGKLRINKDSSNDSDYYFGSQLPALNLAQAHEVGLKKPVNVGRPGSLMRPVGWNRRRSVVEERDEVPNFLRELNEAEVKGLCDYVKKMPEPKKHGKEYRTATVTSFVTSTVVDNAMPTP